MILIGTMNLTRTRDRGDFYCPTCGTTHSYRLRARRPFLTLYFIPTVPIGGAEVFVQCDQCRSSWDPTVLEMDRKSHEAAQAEQFRDEAIRSSVLTALADDDVTSGEIDTLQRVATGLFERPIDREELGELCSIARQNGIEAKNYVLTVSQRWSREQRVRALQAMFLVATTEGTIGPRQMATLKQMREVLKLTDREYEQAIEEALSWESV